MPYFLLAYLGEDFWRWQTMNPNGYRSEPATNGTSVEKPSAKAGITNGTHTNGDSVKATNGH